MPYRFWKTLLENGWLLPVIALAGSNLFLFYPHYAGQATFPWDFIGGYHSHAFGWISYGDALSPPKWFPWGEGGFPAALALQSGAWYLPIVLLDLLDRAYTIEIATALQAAHPLLGSLGCFFLLRRLQCAPAAALVGALAFQLSSGFYSNQQHVDIVRAYALLPWVLWAFHPRSLRSHALGPLVAAFIGFQFLVAAYPGNIAAAAYGCAIWGVFWAWRAKQDGQAVQYLTCALMAALAAISLSMIKWAPFIALLDQTAPGHASLPIQPDVLATLVFPYDRGFLSHNLTMRSIFLPFAAILGVIFLSRRDSRAGLGAALIVASLLLGAGSSWAKIAGLPLPPGMDISRFHLSDWRPFFQLGIIIMGARGWTAALGGGMSGKPIAARIAMLLLAASAALTAAYQLGYVRQDFEMFGLLIGCGVVLALLVARGGHRVIKLAGFLAVFLTFANGAQHQLSQQRPWNLVWNPAVALQLYGAMDAPRRLPDHQPLIRRPERFVLGDDKDAAFRLALKSQQNQCWYAAQFCLFGYNNLKIYTPHLRLRAAMKDPDTGDALFRFMRGAHQLVITDGLESFHPPAATADTLGTEPFAHARIAGAKAEAVEYGADEVSYKLSLPQAAVITENELWYPGWEMRLCSDARTCGEASAAFSTPQGLRSWQIAAGDWLVKTRYVPPGQRIAVILFGAGVLLALLAALVGNLNFWAAPAARKAAAHV